MHNVLVLMLMTSIHYFFFLSQVTGEGRFSLCLISIINVNCVELFEDFLRFLSAVVFISFIWINEWVLLHTVNDSSVFSFLRIVR